MVGSRSQEIRDLLDLLIQNCDGCPRAAVGDAGLVPAPLGGAELRI